MEMDEKMDDRQNSSNKAITKSPKLSPTEHQYIKVLVMILGKELLSPSATKAYKMELINRLKFLAEHITGT